MAQEWYLGYRNAWIILVTLSPSSKYREPSTSPPLHFLPSFLPSFLPDLFIWAVQCIGIYNRSNYHLISYWSTRGYRAVDWSTKQILGFTRGSNSPCCCSSICRSILCDNPANDWRSCLRRPLDSLLWPWLEQLVQYDSWEEYHCGCLEHSIRCLPHPRVAVPTVRSYGWECFVDNEHSTVHRVSIWRISATISI